VAQTAVQNRPGPSLFSPSPATTGPHSSPKRFHLISVSTRGGLFCYGSARAEAPWNQRRRAKNFNRRPLLECRESPHRPPFSRFLAVALTNPESKPQNFAKPDLRLSASLPLVPLNTAPGPTSSSPPPGIAPMRGSPIPASALPLALIALDRAESSGQSSSQPTVLFFGRRVSIHHPGRQPGG